MERLTVDGLPAPRLAERWDAPRVELFGALPSVLDAVHELAGKGAPAGTIVLAEQQTAGRGRGGHLWYSPPGGVWLGFLLRPESPALSPTAIRVGLALSEAVDDLSTSRSSRLKWPNDVLLWDRKLAGVLCEGRWQGDSLQWVAVGLGVNVANPIPPALAAHAIALREVVPHVRCLDVLDRLVPGLLAQRIPEIPQGHLADDELAAFAERDWLRGRALARPACGRAGGITPEGALLIESASGTVAVTDGHVELG